MKKKLAVLLLALALTTGLLTLPAAATGSSPESTARADKLVSLHLFQGTANGYQLDNTPTRLQGLIMLTRLLGLEDEALACESPNPFTDVSGGGDRYAAYAYANGLTTGVTATTFNPGGKLSASNYVTFLLRALGYDDGAGDFNRASQMDFAADLGMMTPAAGKTLVSLTLNRGDMVDLSYAALTCRMKDGDRTLAEKLRRDGVFTDAEGRAAQVLGDGAGWTYEYTPKTQPAAPSAPSTGSGPVTGVSYERKSVAGITAHVLTVDTRDPRVHVKTAMVNNTVGATAPFKDIVERSGAYAAVNGNFFASYSDFKAPIGHVMVDGAFLYGNSGISSLGITEDGEIRVGRLPLFTRIVSGDGRQNWTAYEINTTSAEGSVLYTPAFGSSVTLRNGGSVMTVSGGSIAGFRSVSAGETVSIPAGGFVVYMDSAFTSTSYFQTPVTGTPVGLEYYNQGSQGNDFDLDGVVSVVSGAPRLVEKGSIVNTLEPGFTEERFTVNASPRTAAGVNGQGKLVLVSTPAATIQQMRQAMLDLGCVDAFNLDGGASCAMYHNGTYLATPGRELTVTLQIFVDR